MHSIAWVFLPCPLKDSLPNFGAIVLSIHGFLNSQKSGLVVFAYAKPPRSVPYPQLGALGILLGMALQRQNRAVVAQEGLVPDKQLVETLRRRSNPPTVMLL